MADHHRRAENELVQEVLLDDPDFLKHIVRQALQQILEAEMTQHVVGAAPYERTEDRRGHRNGYKERTLKTRLGTLELLVPKDREGTFSTRLFARYQRNEKALVLALMEMYVEGVSTRKVKDITEALCGTSFSKSLVWRLAGELDSELEAWRNRPLEAEAYPYYLFVDARYEKVRVDGWVVGEGVLIVTAVRDDGFREILGVEVADTESEATYQELFKSLKARGLKGVELVVSDDHEGLKAAIERHFQGASWQRWQFHYVKNLLKMVAAEKREELGAGLREVFAASTRRTALSLAEQLADRWRKKGCPKEGGRSHRRAHGGVPLLPVLPREPPAAHPYYQWARKVQPGDKASDAGGEDLPQQGVVLTFGHGVGGRAVGGMANGSALPGYGGVERTPLEGAGRKGGGAYGTVVECSWGKLQKLRDLTRRDRNLPFSSHNTEALLHLLSFLIRSA